MMKDILKPLPGNAYQYQFSFFKEILFRHVEYTLYKGAGCACIRLKGMEDGALLATWYKMPCNKNLQSFFTVYKKSSTAQNKNAVRLSFYKLKRCS